MLHLPPWSADHPYGAGQVWSTKTLFSASVESLLYTGKRTSVFTAHIVTDSIALIFAPSSLSREDYQILIYSSEHLSSIVFLIHLTGHARPNSSNPKASGVCAQFPSLSLSLILWISPNPFEMVAMNLHCIRWCGKQPSPKWLLMIMPHCKECEHSMEMLQQAWRTWERRCAVEYCGKDRLGGDAIIL